MRKHTIGKQFKWAVGGVVVAGALVVACNYTTTLMHDVRAIAANIVDTDPGQGGTCDPTGIARRYNFTCSNIAVDVCKDAADTKQYFGIMRWTVPYGSAFANGPCGPDAFGDICCQANNCYWRGLNKNTGTGKGGAADCVVRWRSETRQSTGCREGNGGTQVCPGVPNPDIGYDLEFNVE